MITQNHLHFLMDASMLGVGVGFDTKGAGQILVKGIDTRKKMIDNLMKYQILVKVGLNHLESTIRKLLSWSSFGCQI